jgi:putative transposase
MRYNFSKFALFFLDDVPHKEFGASMPNTYPLVNATTGQMYIHEYPNGEKRFLDDQAFDDLLIDGTLKIVDEGRLVSGDADEVADWDRADCDELDPQSRKRLVECQVLDENGVANGVKAIAAWQAEHWKGTLQADFGQPSNPHTLRRWRSERGTPGQREQRQMVRMWGRTSRDSLFDDPIHECIQRAALRFCVARSSYAAAEAEVVHEVRLLNKGELAGYAKPETAYDVPSYATVRRACIALESSITAATRNGDLLTDRTWHGGGRPLEAARALELGIIDHSPIPAVVIIDPERGVALGQPGLSALIDVNSNTCTAHVISFNAPSLWTVAELIRRANLPKRPPPKMLARYPGLARICGKHSEIIVDNGAEFRGHGLEDMAKSIGFAIRFCPVRKPRYKAKGERFFRTFFRKLDECLPGATLPIELARRSGYDAKVKAVLTMNQLEALANQIVAEIHTEPSDALSGRQPLLVFEKSVAIHGIDMIHDVSGLMRELMEVRQGVQISKSGVRMFGLRYSGKEAVRGLLDDLVALEPKRQRRDDATATTKVKFHPADISSIQVWNRKRRKYVELRCDDPTYSAGMPLWLHEHLRDLATKEQRAFNTHEERMEVRHDRIQAIRNISKDASEAEKTLMAKLYEIPRIRQITGNIVNLDTTSERPALEDYIAHDVAATTSLDDEILSPRPDFGSNSRRRNEDEPRDRRDAGKDRKLEVEPPRRRSSRRVAGEGK